MTASDPPRAPAGLVRRAGRALRRWWPAHEGTYRPTRQVQWQALVAVLDDAVAAQPVADRIVAACGEPGAVDGSVAQSCGRQITVYHRLTVRLRALDLDADLAALRGEASRLLTYHQWMLHQAVNLAFGNQQDDRIEAVRLRLNGLGAPADTLRALRDEIRRRADQPPRR